MQESECLRHAGAGCDSRALSGVHRARSTVDVRRLRELRAAQRALDGRWWEAYNGRMTPALQRLGTAVRTARTARGLTQAELGERTRLSLHSVSRVERADADVPFSTVVALAHALDLDLATIAGVEGSTHATDRAA